MHDPDPDRITPTEGQVILSILRRRPPERQYSILIGLLFSCILRAADGDWAAADRTFERLLARLPADWAACRAADGPPPQ
jgi:hypothetical protein